MKKTLLVALAFFIGNAFAQAQCLTDQLTDQLFSSPDQKEKAFEKMAKDLNEYRDAVENGNQTKSAGKIIIPVVFHVIHTYGSENISKEQIESQIEILNRDFSASNYDVGSVRNQFKSLIANLNIEFRLATKDPQGKCTEGITRTYSTLGRMTREETKTLIGWDNKKYMNIWVVESIRSDNNDGTTTLGFAYLPQSVAANPGYLNSRDGIVIISSYVGDIGTSDVNKAGRTLTHEIGHYLGLNHPFNNGCGSNDCNSSGDFICDTPPVAAPSFGCSKIANSCHQDNPDMPDMTENFMDYANGNCQHMFTLGQKQVVDYIFSQPLRASLVSGSNLVATGTADPYPAASCAPIADLSSDTIIICAGSVVSFKNQSYNGKVTTYNWTLTGANPSTSNIENPTVLYNTPGNYNVILEVSNTNGSSTITRNSIVLVRPSVAVAKAPQYENFQNKTFPPANWTIPSSNTLAWTRSSNSSDGNQGSAMVKINNNNTDDNALASLELQPIDLSTIGTSGYLNFKVAYIRRTNASEVLRLYGSIDCGVNYILLKQFIASSLYGPNSGFYTGADWSPSNGSEWLQVTYPLSNTDTKPNYIFKFEAVSHKGNNIFIDDINIENFAASVQNPVASDLNIYPNPSNGELNIQATIGEETQVKLVDMSGKTILSFGNIKPNQNNYRFEMNSVSPGMYLIVLKNTKGTQYQKLIIQK